MPSPQSIRRRQSRTPTSFPVQQQHLQPLDVGAMPEYWHPDRPAVEKAPAEVTRQLALIHPSLALTRPPAGAPIDPRAWLVWMQKRSIRHYLCPGWKLLFVWETTDAAGITRPLPLDNRLYATIYARDRRLYASAVGYFDDIVLDIKRRKSALDVADRDQRHDIAHDLLQHKKIKNIGAGNKFALHHDGTLIPGRGEANWLQERERHSLPSDVLQRLRDEKGA